MAVDKKLVGTFFYQNMEYKIVVVESGATSDDALFIYKGDIMLHRIKGIAEIDSFYCADSMLTLIIKHQKIILNLKKSSQQ